MVYEERSQKGKMTSRVLGNVRETTLPGFDASGDQKLGGGAFDELVEARVGEAKLARDRYMVGQMGNILAT